MSNEPEYDSPPERTPEAPARMLTYPEMADMLRAIIRRNAEEEDRRRRGRDCKWL